MSEEPIDWVLWAGTVGLESPVEPRIAAAVECGYSYMTVSPLDLARWEEAGGSTVELGRRIRDAGLRVMVDPVMNWYPGGGPPRSRFARFTTEESLRMVADLGAAAFTALSSGTSEGHVDELVEPFARLCDRGADLGVLVQLEFIPMTVVANLEIALRIVQGADRANGGILFDTWHFYRGDPDFDVLAATPGELILAVQLDDARPEVEGSLWDDTQRRLAPGDGSFDLVRAVRALADIGGLRRVGPEIIHPDWAAMTTVDAARRSGEKSRALVERALAGRVAR